jgi:hypothetical protein
MATTAGAPTAAATRRKYYAKGSPVEETSTRDAVVTTERLRVVHAAIRRGRLQSMEFFSRFGQICFQHSTLENPSALNKQYLPSTATNRAVEFAFAPIMLLGSNEMKSKAGRGSMGEIPLT